MTTLKARMTKIALSNHNVVEAIQRGFIEIKEDKAGASRVIYHLAKKKDYDWTDPEEWVRARSVAFLVVEKGYMPHRMLTEVTVPRRTPSDLADIVVFSDDACSTPYLVVENKADGQSDKDRDQGIERMFGNANSLGAPLGLYDEWGVHVFFDVKNHPPLERQKNRRGGRASVPENYGNIPAYAYVAGTASDIKPAKNGDLENKIRKAHSIIWSGGLRDPLTAFDEWSKLLYAKALDEKTTQTGQPRKFQCGTNETATVVANRIHKLFREGIRDDDSIFPTGISIDLSDKKIHDVVEAIQDISLMDTDVDTIGAAFENFFGSVFRGELGQYFTMRPLARFAVAMLGIGHTDHVIDPTCGSGGFLLESLLQVWHSVDRDFKGQNPDNIIKAKTDFADKRVFGIEIHNTLARICKINLLLHHDGHTNIEAAKSCLDTAYSLPRLQSFAGKFSRVVGNPPFGDTVEAGDIDHLGANTLAAFKMAEGRVKVASEHIVTERCVDLLSEGGRLGLVLPDGMFNNQGEPSNCPRMRVWLAKRGHIESIVSLPDFAFRRSGAQNKTSILFFRKFSAEEQKTFDSAFNAIMSQNPDLPEDEAVAVVWSSSKSLSGLWTFMAEANKIGYTPSGVCVPKENDLYVGGPGGMLASHQTGSVLGEWERFKKAPSKYVPSGKGPVCVAAPFHEIWAAHPSRRLDPKYHIFKRTASAAFPAGGVRERLGNVISRVQDTIEFGDKKNSAKVFKVMTIGNNGEIRERPNGIGRNPPSWIGSYFADSSSKWFAAKKGDVVFSSIDLWKGCISVVPKEFDGALVTKEFPIYRITDARLKPDFLRALLASRYFQRAFRAITTGHSNRRRTQESDFEDLEICFPATHAEQDEHIKELVAARDARRAADERVRKAEASFSNTIDGRGDESLPDVDATQSGDDGAE